MRKKYIVQSYIFYTLKSAKESLANSTITRVFCTTADLRLKRKNFDEIYKSEGYWVDIKRNKKITGAPNMGVEQPRTRQISVRVNSSEEIILRERAKASGLDFSNWMRWTLLNSENVLELHKKQ